MLVTFQMSSVLNLMKQLFTLIPMVSLMGLIKTNRKVISKILFKLLLTWASKDLLILKPTKLRWSLLIVLKYIFDFHQYGKENASVHLLWQTLSSDINWDNYIGSITKSAVKKIGSCYIIFLILICLSILNVCHSSVYRILLRHLVWCFW